MSSLADVKIERMNNSSERSSSECLGSTKSTPEGGFDAKHIL